MFESLFNQIYADNIETRYTENLRTEQSANSIFNFMKKGEYLYKAGL